MKHTYNALKHPVRAADYGLRGPISPDPVLRGPQEPDDPRVAERARDMGLFRQMDAVIRGGADGAMLGHSDEFAARMEALPHLAPGGMTYEEARRRAYEREAALSDLDRRQLPYLRAAGELAGAVGLALLFPSKSPVGAVAQGALMGGVSAAGNAEGSFGRRLAEVPRGAALGAAASGVTYPAGRALDRYAAPAVGRITRAMGPAVAASGSVAKATRDVVLESLIKREIDKRAR